jgi:putative ABC transport system permease protein
MLKLIFGILFSLIVVVLIGMFRNRIIASMSLRNIFRQRMNTALVVLGSLMGTALITGSFAMTDSFNKFIFSRIENEFGEIDEIVYKKSAGGSQIHPYFDDEELDSWFSELKLSSLSDGILPVIRIEAQVKAESSDEKRTGLLQNFIKVSLLGAQWSGIEKFGSNPLSIKKPELKEGIPGIYISEDLAASLKVKIGDYLLVSTTALQQLAFWSKLPEVYIAGIIPKASFLNYSGVGRLGINGSLFLDDVELRKLLNIDPSYRYNEVLISNRGDFTAGISRTEAVIESFKRATSVESFQLDTTKKDMAEIADEGNFGLVFLGLSAFAILAGVLLISNTFKMLSEERQIELATMRALGYKKTKVMLVMVFEGFFYSILSSVIGIIAGVFITRFILGQFVNFISNIASIIPFELPIPIMQENIEFSFHIKPVSLLYSFVLGLSIPLTVILYTSRRNANMNIVDSIRGIPPAWDTLSKKRFQLLWYLSAFLSFIIFWRGITAKSELIYTLGVIMLLFFIPLLLPAKDKRWVITLASFAVIGFSMWHQTWLTHEPIPDPWVILVKGVAILLSCLLLVIFNLKIFESLLRALFSRSRISKGVTKIAIAFPSKNRTRTGLTIAMYTLVIFIVTLISIIPYSEEKVIRKSRNNLYIGKDLLMVKSPFGSSFSRNNGSISDFLRQRTEVSEITILRSGTVRTAATQEATKVLSVYAFSKDLSVDEKVGWGVIPSLSREITSVDSLIRYLVQNQGTAVIVGAQSFAQGIEVELVGSSGFTDYGGLSDFQTVFNRNSKPVTTPFSLKIIGYINDSAFSFVQGLLTYEKSIPSTFLNNAQTATFVTVQGASEKEKEASVKTLSEEILAQGYIPLYVNDIIKIMSAMIDGIIGILRSFLYFGMVVGIAGIAILMFRALYERKRIIGMLKAIGYTKSHIFQSFFIETSFIVLIGIVLGIVAGILTSQQFLSVLNFSELEIPLSIPWTLLFSVCIVFYTVSIAVTFIPSYLAAKIPPAEALRYFE